MKTTLLYSIAALAALALLALACTADEPASTETSAATAALTVESVAIAGSEPVVSGSEVATYSSNPATRAAVLPTPVTAGTLYVGMRTATGYPTAIAPLAYTYTSGQWLCATGAIELNSRPASLYGYILNGHAASGNGTGTPITIGMTSQDYADSRDLLYATSGGENVCTAHPYVGFVLKHAYARLRVNITVHSSLPVATYAKLESVAVDATGMYATGTLTPATDAIATGTASAQQLWNPNTAITGLPNRTYTADKLMVPAVGAVTGAQLTVKVSGTTWKADLSAAPFTLQAGKTSIINATLRAAGLMIMSVEVEDWADGGTHSGDMQVQ